MTVAKATLMATMIVFSDNDGVDDSGEDENDCLSRHEALGKWRNPKDDDGNNDNKDDGDDDDDDSGDNDNGNDVDGVDGDDNDDYDDYDDDNHESVLYAFGLLKYEIKKKNKTKRSSKILPHPSVTFQNKKTEQKLERLEKQIKRETTIK